VSTTCSNCSTLAGAEIVNRPLCRPSSSVSRAGLNTRAHRTTPANSSVSTSLRNRVSNSSLSRTSKLAATTPLTCQSVTVLVISSTRSSGHNGVEVFKASAIYASISAAVSVVATTSSKSYTCGSAAAKRVIISSDSLRSACAALATYADITQPVDGEVKTQLMTLESCAIVSSHAKISSSVMLKTESTRNITVASAAGVVRTRTPKSKPAESRLSAKTRLSSSAILYVDFPRVKGHIIILLMPKQVMRWTL